MIILQLDSDQLKSIVQDAVRKAISEVPAPSVDPSAGNGDLLSIDDAMVLLNLAKPTIYGLVCQSKIPCMKKGKKLYFSRQELTTWIKQGRKKTLAEMEQEADIQFTAQKKRG